MKRLPFNTITVLWGIVIFLASCAFTNRTQKAQLEQSNSTLQPPSKDFIQQLKLRNSCMDENSYPTHCYDFTEVDFENYAPPTFYNFTTTYSKLFDLSVDDVIIPKNKMTYNKNTKLGQYSYQNYIQNYRGCIVYDAKGQECNVRIFGDSSANKIFTMSAKLISYLNVDTLCTYPRAEALIKAQDVVPMKDGEFFTWEKWKYKEGSGQEQLKSWFFPPVPQKVIYQDKIAYRFELPKKTVEADYVVVEVFIDAQNGEVLFIKNPSSNNLSNPTKTNYSLNKLLVESEVEYTVENPIISGANNEFLEFDINVASMMNNEDFYSGEILIDYNSLTFGTNLASSGRITLTKGTVITAPNYTLSIVDISTDQMKITAQSSPSNPSSYYTITNQSEELAHIKIDISNLAGNTGIEFDEIQMQGLSELFDASLSSNEPFDLVTATDELNIDINGILNVMNTCTTCPNGVGNWLQNQNPCPVANCACNDNVFSDVVNAAPTHYYQCKNIGFKDCDNDDLIKLEANQANENILIWEDIGNNNANPVTWCEINNEIALSPKRLIEANAMYSVQTSNDYFSAAFNINSYDNNGTPLMIMTHTQSLNGGPSNAAANHAPQPMTLGDGVPGQCEPMVSLDIVAHEYTHGVLNNYIILNQDLLTTTALQFSTKALHEALADIFSVIIRHDENGGQNTWNNQSIWTVGAEACTNHPEVPRFINAPQNSVSVQASYYQDPVHNWSNNQMDYYNRAGVISYWFYLLSTGQQGVNGDIIQQALGINGSEDVVIEALQLMLNDGNTQYTFEAFRDFTVQAAINLHGVCSDEHRSVVEAWVAVGLFDCANINITFEENDPTPADPCDKELTAKVNNGSGCYTFEWFRIDNGVEVPLNLNGVTIPVLCNNTYRVKVVDTFLGIVGQPCDEEADRAIFATSTRKVEELNLDVTIRPTLANNQIFFDLEIEEPTTITISIFDQLGRRISQPIVNEKVYQGNRTIQHNVENLSSGIYFVNIETPKGKIVKKFVKM